MAKIIDETEKKQINLNILQKEDKTITSILGNASHIVIYKFDNNRTVWDRIGVEGSAFVVSASTAPHLRLLVLNRLNPNTYTLDLSQVTKLKLQSPYLMLRLASQEHSIMGLWSHEESDRQTLKDAMESGLSVLASKSKVTPTFSAPVSQSTTQQLKKLLVSPKKEPNESSSSILQASPPSIESSAVDPDDFLSQLSQNTNSFHAATHFGGRPISPLPPRTTTTPSPLNISEDSNKTRVLTQVLSIGSNSNSQANKTKRLSGNNGNGNGNGTITGIAILGNKHSDGFLTDSEITAQATLNTNNNNNNSNNNNGGGKLGSPSLKISSYELLAPSDLTGKKSQFTKLK